MKLNLIIVLLLTFSFSACKRQYAMVQPAQNDDFVIREKRSQPIDFKIEEMTNAELSPEVKSVNDHLEISAYNYQIADNQLINSSSKKHSDDGFFEKVTVNKTVAELKKEPSKKRKKPLIKRVNSFVPMGLISLGIAILLSLVNLNGLALLFGIASIIFLYLGIKKYLKRQKRRQIFK